DASRTVHGIRPGIVGREADACTRDPRRRQATADRRAMEAAEELGHRPLVAAQRGSARTGDDRHHAEGREPLDTRGRALDRFEADDQITPDGAAREDRRSVAERVEVALPADVARAADAVARQHLGVEQLEAEAERVDPEGVRAVDPAI